MSIDNTDLAIEEEGHHRQSAIPKLFIAYNVGMRFITLTEVSSHAPSPLFGLGSTAVPDSATILTKKEWSHRLNNLKESSNSNNCPRFYVPVTVNRSFTFDSNRDIELA